MVSESPDRGSGIAPRLGSPDSALRQSTWRSAAGAVTLSLTPNNTGGFFPARARLRPPAPGNRTEKPPGMPVSVPYAANHATLPKTRHMRPSSMSRDPEAALPPYFSIPPTRRWPSSAARSAPATSPPSPRPAPAAAPTSPPAATGQGEAQAAAAVLDLGDHPLPDPGGAAALPPGAARQPRPAPGPHRERAGRRPLVHPRRGAAAARAFRRRGLARQGVPALAPGGPAGQGRGGRQLQGRRRQDLDRGAPRDVGGARRLPGAGRRPRQPGLDDLAVRRPGRRRMGHGVPADRPRLRARACARRTAAASSAASRRSRSTRCSRPRSAKTART